MDFPVLKYLKSGIIQSQDTDEILRIKKRARYFDYKNNRLFAFEDDGYKLVPTIAERPLLVAE